MSIHNADSFEFLAGLEDESVDHIITDPPYNISDAGKETMVGPNIVPAEFGDWDKMPMAAYNKWVKELLAQLYRVAKPGANCLLWLDRAYGGVVFHKFVPHEWHPRDMIGAVKRNPAKKRRHNTLKSTWELCLSMSKGPVKTLNWGYGIDGNKNWIFYTIGSKKVSDHETEKYIEMIEPIILTYTNPGDLILDPFCGSGTIPVVCKMKKRRWIGIDKGNSTKTGRPWAEFSQERLDLTPVPLL